ncbi:MAG: hypothetical protein ACYTFH_02065 [Planctomycetota bacterium]|jgi:hypothetical protein
MRRPIASLAARIVAGIAAATGAAASHAAERLVATVEVPDFTVPGGGTTISPRASR